MSVVDELLACAEAHAKAGSECERIGNVGGAVELRRVSNLLYALARGERWMLIRPAPEPDEAVDECPNCGHLDEYRSLPEKGDYEDCPKCWHELLVVDVTRPHILFKDMTPTTNEEH